MRQLLISFYALLCLIFSIEASAATVVRFLPAGEEVTQTDSINITFSEAMVPVGAMEEGEAKKFVQISPAVACEWRWISPETLSCKLSNSSPLKMATRYSVLVRKGFRGKLGATTTSDAKHEWVMSRPRVDAVHTQKWLAPGFPIFFVRVSAKVNADDLLKVLQLKDLAGKTYALKVVPTSFKFNRYEANANLKEALLALPPAKEAEAHFYLHPRADLPGGTKLQLEVLPGLKAAEGGEASIKGFLALQFLTFPEFEHKGHVCQNGSGQEIPSGECHPLQPISLTFSTPVNKEEIKRACTLSPMKDAEALAALWENTYSSIYPEAPTEGKVYSATLPALGKARQEFSFKCANDLSDIFGRKAGRPIAYTFRTSPREPDFRLLHDIGVLEKKADSDASAVVTNLKDVEVHYSTFTAEGGNTGKKIKVDTQNVQDIGYIVPLKVREMLGQASGAVSIFTETPNRRPGFYQVSPYMVHFKDGYFGGALWVRDYETGAPVEGAEISLVKASFGAVQEMQSLGVYGKTDKFGLLAIPGHATDKLREMDRSYDEWSKPVEMILVKKGKEIALLPLTYSFMSYVRSYEEYEYDENSEDRSDGAGHIRAWGLTPQGVYRAGDKIEYKIYLRGQDLNRLTAPSVKNVTLIVTDPTGAEAHRREAIPLNEFGAIDGSFATAPKASVGWYQFQVKFSFAEKGTAKEHSLATHKVLVTDFTPAPFKTANSLDRQIYRKGDKLKLSTSAKLHAGGPFGKAPARINLRLQSKNYKSNNPKLEKYSFGCKNERSSEPLLEDNSNLNEKGEIESSYTIDNKNMECGQIVATSDVADDRGKFYSSVATADYFRSGRFIGARQEKFIYQSGDEWKADFIVVDSNGGKILNNIAFTVDLEQRDIKIARVKGPGNAYLEEAHEEWKKISSCSKKSDTSAVNCAAKLPASGSYRFIAKVKDDKGNENTNQQYFWVSGKEILAWESGESKALQIIAEKKKPRVGEKAKYLVQNPLPGAEAWITIERYGVIKSWAQKFQSSTPIIEFEVEPDMLPGFYLSVVVFAPRVDKPVDATQVDLGKPTFRQGYITVDVDNPVKELQVTAATEKKEYRPGDMVKVSLEAQSRVSSLKTGPVEFAVAVLDESVFDLIQGGTRYFDIYHGLNWLSGLDVKNLSTLMMLVGRRKYEKKGANAGGDGGGLSSRSNFRYVAHWAPSLKADSKGRVNFEFKVPDNLTAWKILAIATNPSDRMGLGEGRFQVNQAIEIRPTMPNLVREGDSFTASFSVMNRTEKKISLNVELSAQGDITANKAAKISQTIEAAPFERKIIDLPLEASLLKEDRLIEGGKISFRASASGGGERDALEHALPVLKKRTIIAAGSYRSTTESLSKETVAFPKNIYTDVGGVKVSVSPSVIGNIDGAFTYMRNYPFACWEQRLTKGVLASSYIELRDYLDPKLEWPGAKEIMSATLAEAKNFQAPNGGMCYYAPSSERVSPYLSAFTALAFEWLKARGEKTDLAFENSLHSYLQELLRKDQVPTNYNPGMNSTVNAVALAALAKAKKIKAADLDRYRASMTRMDLFGKAHFLQAALAFPDREAVAKETLNTILGTANETAGKFRFTENLDSTWLHIHSTELRTQCAILSAISQAAAQPWAKALLKDIPFKLLRFITDSRGARAHWENTQENLFCSEAIRDYAKRYEAEKPDMKLEISLGADKIAQGGLKDFRDKPLVGDYATKASDPGRTVEVKVAKSGPGRFYHSTMLRYAPKEDFKTARNAGMEIRSEWSVERNGKFMLLKEGMKVAQGERLRADIFLTAPSARNFVVVDIAVPAGLEPLNTDLANTSKVDAGKAIPDYDRDSFYFKLRDWVYFGQVYNSFYHREVRHDSVRYYSELLEKGSYSLSFMTQAVAAGIFAIPPAKAEEMYDADIFGHSVGGVLQVERK